MIGIGKVFDEIAIEPADRPSEGRVTSGPFVVGRLSPLAIRAPAPQSLLLGKGLERCLAFLTQPACASTFSNNPEQEIRLFLRGEYDLIDSFRRITSSS